MTIDQSRADSISQVVSQVNGKPVTRGQLEAAFEKVKPIGNWKNPISAVVILDVEEMAMIEEAIRFFTGSVAEFVELAKLKDGKGRYRVRADGYYLAIGA